MLNSIMAVRNVHGWWIFLIYLIYLFIFSGVTNSSFWTPLSTEQTIIKQWKHCATARYPQICCSPHYVSQQVPDHNWTNGNNWHLLFSCFVLYNFAIFFKVKPLWFNELVVTYINRDKHRQIIVLLRDWNNEHRDVLLTLPFLGSSPGQQWHNFMRKTPAHAAVVESGHHRTWRFKPCKKFVAECFLYCFLCRRIL